MVDKCLLISTSHEKPERRGGEVGCAWEGPSVGSLNDNTVCPRPGTLGTQEAALGRVTAGHPDRAPSLYLSGRYLYCGELTVLLAQAIPLHQLATKYRVASLQRGVADYMRAHLVAARARRWAGTTTR